MNDSVESVLRLLEVGLWVCILQENRKLRRMGSEQEQEH